MVGGCSPPPRAPLMWCRSEKGVWHEFRAAQDARSNLRFRRGRPARPNIWRRSILSRLMWPSVGPLLRRKRSIARIAVRSRQRLRAKPRSSATPLCSASCNPLRQPARLTPLDHRAEPVSEPPDETHLGAVCLQGAHGGLLVGCQLLVAAQQPPGCLTYRDRLRPWRQRGRVRAYDFPPALQVPGKGRVATPEASCADLPPEHLDCVAALGPPLP